MDHKFAVMLSKLAGCLIPGVNMFLTNADLPPTGIARKIQAGLQKLAFDDKMFRTALLIVGALLTVDAITTLVHRYQEIDARTTLLDKANV
jgi:hypothetical protein